MRKILKTCIAELGLDPSNYSTHSLRKAGATIAANENIPKDFIQAHGGWKSDAVNIYIKANETYGKSISASISSSLSRNHF